MASDRPRPVYVEEYGTVYRMAARRWRAFCRAGAEGLQPAASNYGREVCSLDWSHVSDWTPEDFRTALEY